MNGITIIEEHLCRVVELPELIGIGIFVTLLVAGVLLLYKLMWKYDLVANIKKDKIATIVCSIVLVVVYIIFWVVQISNYNTTHFEYTIEVDESVGFNDFFDRYEIVSVDGDRYRVKER